ncbi:MAG: Flp pilus assembly protein CpaB [Desulfobacca sp.]|uniref:Flp pilus assembly protein CpaB n=1 Tax=Desulfobacca sp. TaxID=2067990 RepID=UPI00404B262A
MAKKAPLLLLLLALISGGVAAYLAVSWLQATSQRAQQAAKQTVTMTPVLVAAREIPPGTPLRPELLKEAPWPRDAIVAGTAVDLEKIKGRVTRTTIYPGEVILEHRLAPPGTPGGLAGVLQDNTRAMTIKVDEASGVAGFIMPGNRVDVLLTLNQKKYDDDPVTQIVLQNLLVLGRGQDIEQKEGDKPKVVPTVTLQVTPAEAERLALAAKEGQITLALRGYTEKQIITTEGVKASDLVRPVQKTEAAFENAITPPQESVKKAGIEVLRGTERTLVTF